MTPVNNTFEINKSAYFTVNKDFSGYFALFDFAKICFAASTLDLGIEQ